MTREAIKAMVDAATDFPMLPHTATQIARLTTDLSAPVKEIASKIESDKMLLDRMLTMVNVPFYGVSGPISRITDAISLLGYKKVCNLAVGISAMAIFPSQRENGFDYGQFWGQSILTGISAGLISTRIPGDQPADVFSAALLQNVGILFMVRHQPLEYGTALGMAKGQNIPLVAAERESWGGDHAQVGAEICRKWQMPQLMAEVIRNHHFAELGESLSEGTRTLVQIVNLSGLMSEVISNPDDEALRENLDVRAKEFFGFGPKTLDQIIEKVPEVVKSIGQAFGVVIGREAGKSAVSSAETFHETCPSCSTRGQQGKFCGECGVSLKVEATQKAKLRATRKVVVAEDSIASRRALCFVIKKLGCIPVEATNGQEAIDLARKDPPGMFLLDVVMPGMNGLEALKRIQEDKQLSD
ncbi:MAG: HDOD domain-containing protein, partial [bacterium]|nr:HDOD domain-containing protein [bacterium]